MPAIAPVARNSAVLFGGTAVSKALVFVSYLIMTRSLGAEDFGRFSYLFVYLVFFELLADAGLETLIVREAGRDPAQTRRYLGDALVIRGALVLIAVPLALLLFPWVRGSAGGRGLLLLASANLVVSHRRPSLRSLFEIPYRLALRMELPTLFQAISEVAMLAVLVLSIDRYGLAGAVGSQIVGPALAALAFVAFASRRFSPLIRLEPARLARIGRSTLPLLGALLFNAVLVRVDVLALERFRGSAEVGLYSAPVRLIEVANLFPVLLMSSVFPLMVKTRPEPGRLEELFRGSLRFLVAFLVPFAVVAIAFAGPIVGALFGREFAPGAGVLRILAAAEILVYIDIVLASRLIATDLEKRNLHLVFLAAATCVCANLLLVPTYGAPGAATAVLIAYLARLAAMFLFADTRPAAVAAVRAALPAVAAGTAAALVLILARGWGWPAAVASAATYALLLAAGGGITRADGRLARDLAASIRSR